jgi:hypothetical protein
VNHTGVGKRVKIDGEAIADKQRFVEALYEPLSILQSA